MNELMLLQKLVWIKIRKLNNAFERRGDETAHLPLSNAGSQWVHWHEFPGMRLILWGELPERIGDLSTTLVTLDCFEKNYGLVNGDGGTRETAKPNDRERPCFVLKNSFGELQPPVAPALSRSKFRNDLTA